ncbi:MAG TPA: hypothetical protein EYO33_07740 [Phycisphaerales bacterium]|nr:hypothetical protein [Phycisphaerales bacterium]
MPVTAFGPFQGGFAVADKGSAQNLYEDQRVAPISITLIVGATIIVPLLLTRIKPRLVRIAPEQALLRNRANQPGRDIFFDKAYVIPLFDKYDIMDISVQKIEVSLKGRDGVHCRDNIRADVDAQFYLKIPRDAASVEYAAQMFGVSTVSDPEKLAILFSPRFSEALQTAMRRLDFEENLTKRDMLRDCVVEVIGIDLSGFQIEDVAIDYLEQTALEQLDPENMLDAEGITKITERTAAQLLASTRITRATEKEVQAGQS